MQGNIRVTGLERTKATFQKLASRVKDLTPIWKEFLPYYRNEIVRAGFDTRGKVFSDAWKPLAESTKRRYKSMGVNRSIRTLRLSDDLYNAAIKGSGGGYETIKRDSLIFGVDLPYAAAQNFGYPSRNLPASFYFVDDKGDMIPRAWVKLIELTNKYIEDSDNDK